MTVWSSQDEGETYKVHSMIDPGEAGYSSLAFDTSGALWLLYEQADGTPMSRFLPVAVLNVQQPDRFVLLKVV